MSTFTGFSGDQRRVVQEAHDLAKLVLQKFLDALITDEGMKRFMKKVPTYFGAQATRKVKKSPIRMILGKSEKSTTTVDEDSVSDWVSILLKIANSMLLEIDQNNYQVSYGGASEDNAEMGHLPSNRAGMSKLAPTLHVLEHIRNYVANDVPQGEEQPEMRIFDTFFTRPRNGLRIQSRVRIYLHELSHHAAGTRDVKRPDYPDDKCYEFEGVLACAMVGPHKAVFNAESVSMFLMEFA